MFHIFGYEISIIQIVLTVFGIGIVIFIHELGHFLLAKKFGLKVEKFAFGFGREIFGFTRGETRYSINIFPAGGYVKMPGEDIDSASGDPREFLSAAWYKRLIIAAAGPVMNYVLALVLFTVLFHYWGLPVASNQPIIGEIIEGRPAQAAGLKPGDTIISINSSPVKSWDEIPALISSQSGQKLKLQIERDNAKFFVSITPLKDASSGRGLIGIGPKTESEKMGALQSVELSSKFIVFQSYMTLKVLGSAVIRRQAPEIAGPIGVINLIAKSAKLGIDKFIYLIGIISVALGLFNLLPIPLVDGGHIMMSIIEFVTRRPLNKLAVRVANYIGLALILVIFVYATYSDIHRMDVTGFVLKIGRHVGLIK